MRNYEIGSMFLLGILGVACGGAGDFTSTAQPDAIDDTAGDPRAQHAESSEEETTAEASDAEPGRIIGRVQDAISGDPISGAQVCVFSTGEAGKACAPSTENGHFDLNRFEPGTELLLFTQTRGYYVAYQRVVTSPWQDWVSTSMIPEGAAFIDRDPADETGAVLFRVFSLAQKIPEPMAGMRVSLAEYSAHYTMGDGRFDDAASSTASDGLALLTGVKSGALPISAADAFGAGCEFADYGMDLESTVFVHSGTVTPIVVLCR